MNLSLQTAYKSSNFAPAFLFLSKDRRKALQVIYAFCRVVDDIVDHSYLSKKNKQEAKDSLNAWRSVIILSDKISLRDNSERIFSKDLQRIIKGYSINTKHLLDLIDGVSIDLGVSRFQFFDELKTYCYGVASTVGLACLPLFGLDEKRYTHFAVNLGIAVQLTNIIRDVKTDGQRGRIYIPKEDLNKFQYSERDLLENKYNQHFVELMEYETKRAHFFYDEAKKYLPDKNPRAARSAFMMGRIYRTILKKIEKKKFNVFEEKIVLSPYEKALFMFKGFFSGIF